MDLSVHSELPLTSLKIAVYNDGKSFGGHETQSIKAYEWLLLRGATLRCYYREGNERHREALSHLLDNKRFELTSVPIPNIRYHSLYHFFNPGITQKIAEEFRNFGADAVFISQGNLSISAIGSLAARKANIPSLSYIPMAHDFVELKANKPRRRNLFNSYLSKVPTRWLTISQSMVQRLRDRGADQPVDITPNAVDIKTVTNRASARKLLNIPEAVTVLGMVGRVEPKQKGSDLLCQILRSLPEGHKLKDCWFLILGDGAGTKGLLQALKEAGMDKQVVWKPWVHDPENYYPAYNLILMPSYFEGLPVVMMEALWLGIPVAGTKVDGMGETLPEKWTCPPGNTIEYLKLIEKYLDDPDIFLEPMEEMQSYARRTNNFEAFGMALETSLYKLLEGKIQPVPSPTKQACMQVSA